MRIPFYGGFARGKSAPVSNVDVKNAYLEITPQGVNAVHGTPGLVSWYSLGSSVEVRGMLCLGDYLYAVLGASLYRFDTSVNATLLGTLETTTGIVTMACSHRELCICDELHIYVYNIEDGGDLSIPELPMIELPSWVEWLGNHFLAGESNSMKFWWSNLNDATTWDGLSFSSAEAKPDKLKMALVDHRELWLFGDRSVEVWGYVGGADSPFERIQGYDFEVGLGAKYSPASLDNDIAWVTDNWMIAKGNRGSPVYISTRDIEYQIGKCADKANAIGFSYIYDGHWLYQLTFPVDQLTLVYDASTQLWHQRTSYPNESRHRANCTAYFASKNLVGDFENGVIYELSPTTYTDNAYAITRVVTSDHIRNEGKRLYFDALEVLFEMGVGLDAGVQGYDPKAALSWSDDGGRTWSNEHWVTMGKIGEYTMRARWTLMGMSRQRQFRVVVTDPVKFTIVDGWFTAKPGSN